MIKRFRDFASQHTKGEWRLLAREICTDMRIWLQEHGEKAFLLGLLLGFLGIAFYKLFAVLFALAVIVGILIWEFAPEQNSEEDLRDDTEPDAAEDETQQAHDASTQNSSVTEVSSSEAPTSE